MQKCGRVPALAMVACRTRFCSTEDPCDLAHSLIMEISSLEALTTVGHRWNFKQAQRPLWHWVPRPTPCVVIGQSRCCSFEALYGCTAKVACILQSCRDLTLVIRWTTECRFSTSNVMQLRRLVASYPSSKTFQAPFK